MSEILGKYEGSFNQTDNFFIFYYKIEIFQKFQFLTTTSIQF